MALQHIFIRSKDLAEPCVENICEKLSGKQAIKQAQLLFAAPTLVFSLNIFS